MRRFLPVVVAIVLALVADGADAGGWHGGHHYHHHGDVGLAVGVGLGSALIGTAIVAHALAAPPYVVAPSYAPYPPVYVAPAPAPAPLPLVPSGDAYRDGYRSGLAEARRDPPSRARASYEVFDYGIGATAQR